MIKFRIIAVIVYVSFLTSCINQKIIYNYADQNIENSINKGIAEIISLDSNQTSKSDIYALVYDQNNTICIVLEKKANSPVELAELIKKTNRFIKLESGINLPVVFLADFFAYGKDHPLRLKKTGGYLIQMDYQNEIINRGWVY